MKFSPDQYNFVRSLLEPKIDEIRAAWKASTDEEETERLANELVTARRAADTLEELFFAQ